MDNLNIVNVNDHELEQDIYENSKGTSLHM